MEKYQKDNLKFFKTRSKNSFNQMKYSANTFNPENTKKIKKLFLKLRKKVKYNLLTFLNSKK